MQRQALALNMDGVWAEEVLRERGGDMDNRAIYYLTYMATGDKAAAEEARAKRIVEEMRKGLTPNV